MKTLVFDTETTGKPTDYNAHPSNTLAWPNIVQIAWVVLDGGKILHTYQALIQPAGWEISLEAQAIHGITMEQCEEDGLPITLVLDTFIHDIEQVDAIVAHNLKFDHSVVAAEFFRHGLKASKKVEHKICTMEIGTDLVKLPGRKPGTFKWPTLAELHWFLFNRGFDGAHDAMADVLACAACFVEMRKRKLI